LHAYKEKGTESLFYCLEVGGVYYKAAFARPPSELQTPFRGKSLQCHIANNLAVLCAWYKLAESSSGAVHESLVVQPEITTQLVAV